MADIILTQNDFVRFGLKSTTAPTLWISQNTKNGINAYAPIGWRDSEVEFVRNKNYHGIMTEFTSALGFIGISKDYIESDFRLLGTNSKMTLTRYEKQEIDGEVKWVLTYIGFVDYNTREINEGILRVRFNSNNLERLMQSYGKEEFELERLESVDDNPLTAFETYLTEIKGRTLVNTGGMELILDTGELEFFYNSDGELEAQTNGIYQWANYKGENPELVDRFPGTSLDTVPYPTYYYVTPILKKLSNGDRRVSTPDDWAIYLPLEGEGDIASQMIFVDLDRVDDPELSERVLVNVRIEADIQTRVNSRPGQVDIRWTVWNFDENSSGEFGPYTIEEEFIEEIVDIPVQGPDTYWPDLDNPLLLSDGLGDLWDDRRFIDLNWKGSRVFENLKPGQGITISVYTREIILFEPTFFWPMVKASKWDITITKDSNLEPTQDVKTTFVHDALERLMYILTSEKGRVFSKMFGRTEIGYAQTDELGGLIGMVSGFWIRQFTEDNPLYKSMTISLDKLLSSLQAVFNVGIGVHSYDNVEKLRVEDLRFFYQNDVSIKLGQVGKVKRKTVKEDYFSGIETGYKLGGDYENELGLDEPNSKVSRTTPLNNTSKKYNAVSDVRSDETQMELLRRKPMTNAPKEDTTQDLHNWFLDLKKVVGVDVPSNYYTQNDWDDRLEQLPTGISYPENFRAFIFTPLRILLRHAWVFRTGMEQLITMSKKIKYASSKANVNLGMRFIGEVTPLTENQDLIIGDLDRSRILPEEISFTYPIDTDLLRKINGTTKKIYKGSLEEIPNYYFKFEWINENNEVERGYVTNIKPKSDEFTMIKVNDNLIF